MLCVFEEHLHLNVSCRACVPFLQLCNKHQGQCNGRIFYLFILSYRACLSYLIMVLALSLFFIYGCGLVSS